MNKNGIIEIKFKGKLYSWLINKLLQKVSKNATTIFDGGIIDYKEEECGGYKCGVYIIRKIIETRY